jgi:hypothetical protein
MTKQEANALKDLLTDDEKDFFEQMEGLLMFDSEALNDLKAKKNKLKRNEKDFKGDFITREEYDKNFAKIERHLFELIDVQVKNEVNNYDSNTNLFNNDDTIFDILASIDFTTQESKFKGLIQHRNFAVFVVRGEGVYGQNWLIHQLCKRAFGNFTTKSIRGLNQEYVSLNEIITGLKTNDCDFEEGDTIKEKLEEIASNWIKISSTTVISIACSKDFIQSKDFKIFHKEFIKRINNKMNSEKREIDNKIILFLKDTTIEPYTVLQDIQYWCCETETEGEGKVKGEVEFIRIWQDNTKKKKTPYVIDLHRIACIDEQMLKKWKNGRTEIKILEKLCTEQAIRAFYEECENGNPYLVIQKLGEILKYDESKWIKY